MPPKQQLLVCQACTRARANTNTLARRWCLAMKCDRYNIAFHTQALTDQHKATCMARGRQQEDGDEERPTPTGQGDDDGHVSCRRNNDNEQRQRDVDDDHMTNAPRRRRELR
jgi:hypothetical protein